MRMLKEYIDILSENNLLVSSSADIGVSVEMLTYDDREVIKNTLFICKGVHFKKEYLENALNKGAVAYVSEVDYGIGNGIIVRDIRKSMAYLAKLFYDNSPEKLVSVGITGTKGKSTTAYYIKNILDCFLEKECGVLSSIDNYDGVIREESHLTTPESLMLYRHFDNAYKSRLSHLVMEVSSQALKYDRVLGIKFNVGVFTNIGTDHISPVEHSNFEDYFSAKLKIFDSCRVAVINSGSLHFERIYKAASEKCEKVITFGFRKEDDIFCENVVKKPDGIYFDTVISGRRKTYSISMAGLFNVENALAAISVCDYLGVPEESIEKGLKTARVAGRMEIFESEDKKITVIVDYAHNKMSFNALFESASKEYPDKKRIAVYGCPGLKAQLRRKDLAEASGKWCGLSIITEEDAGEEPVRKISEEIAENIKSVGGEYKIIDDRGEAIRDAIMNHGENKVIFLTGKGRETRQKRGIQYIPVMSDVEYTEKYLAEYNESVKTGV